MSLKVPSDSQTRPESIVLLHLAKSDKRQTISSEGICFHQGESSHMVLKAEHQVSPGYPPQHRMRLGFSCLTLSMGYFVHMYYLSVTMSLESMFTLSIRLPTSKKLACANNKQADSIGEPTSIASLDPKLLHSLAPASTRGRRPAECFAWVSFLGAAQMHGAWRLTSGHSHHMCMIFLRFHLSFSRIHPPHV